MPSAVRLSYAELRARVCVCGVATSNFLLGLPELLPTVGVAPTSAVSAHRLLATGCRKQVTG